MEQCRQKLVVVLRFAKDAAKKKKYIRFSSQLGNQQWPACCWRAWRITPRWPRGIELSLSISQLSRRIAEAEQLHSAGNDNRFSHAVQSVMQSGTNLLCRTEKFKKAWTDLISIRELGIRAVFSNTATILSTSCHVKQHSALLVVEHVMDSKVYSKVAIFLSLAQPLNLYFCHENMLENASSTQIFFWTTHLNKNLIVEASWKSTFPTWGDYYEKTTQKIMLISTGRRTRAWGL